MSPLTVELDPNFVLVAGIPTAKNEGIMICRVPSIEEDNSFICNYQSGKIVGVPVQAVCQWIVKTSNSSLFLSEEGYLWEFKDGEFTDTEPMSKQHTTAPLRGFVQLENRDLIVVGSLNQIYRYSKHEGWKDESQIYPEFTDLDGLSLVAFGFEAVAAFSNSEVYTVGWEGQCYVGNSGNWTKISLPTNADLYAVVCAPDGYVYASGDGGIVLKGRHEKWCVLENDFTDEKFWTMCCHKKRVLVASNFDLYEIKDEKLIETDYEVENDMEQNIHMLSSNGELLWVMGEHSLIEFDGNSWNSLYVGKYL